MQSTAALLLLVASAGLFVGACAQLDPTCASCPSKNCTYDQKLICSCVGVNRTIEIVNPGDIEYYNVSLGFAVDTTGSMGPEIASIKASIIAVVNAVSSTFDKVVVGTFNDPFSSSVVESNNPATVNSFVSGLGASGGGDCPEMALSGIQDVANRVSPGSVIFVFTDASAKDLTLEPAVKALLLSKNIRLNVLATGDLCGLGDEFRRLTAATNGTIYTTPNKADVDYVMNYIKNFAKYGIRFIRGMPTTLEDLIAVANGTCSCSTITENLVCLPPNEVKCPCPKGYEMVEVRKKICRPCPTPTPPPKPTHGSLGFVIDDTGSMSDEISAVKTHIKAIIAANKLFKDYVMGRFGDPYVKNVIRSSSEATITTFLDAITASGGGDCPEFALSGVEDAVKAALPKSILILFTDASAKDASKKASVANLLKAKDTRLFVVATGDLCGASYSNEYHDLASGSGGAVMTLTAKTSVADVLDFIRKAAAGEVSFDEFPTSLDGLTPRDCCTEVVKHHCKKIKLPCPHGYRRVDSKQKVCPIKPQCPRKKVGSLGFVIDDTGSMAAEIFAVRAHITSIIGNNTMFVDYVMGRFGDPYVKNVIRSSSEATIVSFLNAITASGGGDCPEFAMSGIEDAAKLARKNSVLILFTDAAAKDASKKVAVAALLKSKKIKLFVVATGTLCGPAVYGGEFHYLASETGGAVMTLTAKTSVSEVLDFIGLAASGAASFDHFPASLDDLRKYRARKCWVQEISTCVCDCDLPLYRG